MAQRPTAFSEPHFSQFCELLRAGAGSVDIHDVKTTSGVASPSDASNNFLLSELARVEQHRKAAGDLLAAFVPPRRSILDVGCGTGGCSVGMAISTLSPTSITGVDVSVRALHAAMQRAAGYGLSRRLNFRSIAPNEPLPFDDGAFDLVVSISVLEFVTLESARVRFLSELQRVSRGWVFLATPRRSWREHHSGRWLGNVLKRDGYPWASRPKWIRAQFRGWERIALEGELLRAKGLPASLAAVAGPMMPWRKMLFRKPR